MTLRQRFLADATLPREELVIAILGAECLARIINRDLQLRPAPEIAAEVPQLGISPFTIAHNPPVPFTPRARLLFFDLMMFSCD
jgi:hypothetical protein